VLSRVPLLGRPAQKRIQPMIDVHLDFVEAELAGRPWFAGEAISAADVMMSLPLEAARARGGLGPEPPAHARLARPGPCPPRLPARARQGRPLRLRLTPQRHNGRARVAPPARAD
jgi:glutathione S-transferase